MKVNSETICAYSKKPLCPHCKGAVYECDPFKNIPCRKTFCGECGYTTQIEYAKNTRPLCPRNLVTVGQEKRAEQSGIGGGGERG